MDEAVLLLVLMMLIEREKTRCSARANSAKKRCLQRGGEYGAGTSPPAELR